MAQSWDMVRFLAGKGADVNVVFQGTLNIVWRIRQH
jgi:hypothetical protein